MQSQAFLSCAAVCILMTFCLVQSKVLVRYHVERSGDPTTGNVNLTCKCGNTKEVVKAIDSTMMEEIMKENVELESCSKKIPGDICNLITTCKSCIIHAGKCANAKHKNGKHDSKCNKDIYKFEKYYNEEEHTTAEKNITHREKRGQNACVYPRNLKTSDVSCRVSGKSTRCQQQCILGYTLPTGTSVTRTCKKKNNEWKPSGFRECRPYVDCTLTLTAPGVLDCYTATTKAYPLCYVSCDKYEDRKKVPRRAYQCSGDATWSQPLPFCIEKGSAIEMVPPPTY